MARIRSTGRQKPAVSPHDVDLRHLWRQLREAGWRSRRPKGLENDWTYLKPGASTNGTVGADIFVGEAAVVAYVIDSGLLATANEDEAAEENDSDRGDEMQHDEDGEAGEIVEDVVRASQINTTVELSQRTMDAMFGSPPPIGRAFELSQGGSQSEPDVLEGATQLQHMSGASGAESAESDAPVARRLRPRREFKRDVNFVEENENLDDYEQLSSGESDGNAIADIDDDNVEPRGMDEAEYVISATDSWMRLSWLRLA
ncbi:Hypothetical protein PHPALM_13439 [Phytophthora palmivora]|uniref:Uncharacterized protein n=1 Tax=Phytophthora palmivora TaxID=4796 RepID=A0A2P4XX91_9STRA|nr:Hypothetical protein PHPALM_13439 [Phytophthora palmivora]